MRRPVEKFLDAIDVKPKREDAYAGAAKGYIGLEEPEKATEILEKGLENMLEPGAEYKDLCDELGVAYEGQNTASSAAEESVTAPETVAAESATSAPQSNPVDTTKESTTKKQTMVLPEHTDSDEYHAIVIAQGGLSLRYGPGQSYDRILIIPNGTAVVEAGYNDDPGWIYVKYNNQYGWVKAEYIAFEGGMAKPVIYLYPQRETKVSVNLNIINGALTCSYPGYNHGWDVTAFPGGRIINNADGKEYSYLYWEAISNIKYDFSKGFVVRGSDTVSFLQNKLAEIGLTPKEYNEFIVYWLPLMQDNEYNLISFQDAVYTNTAQLKITPQPDSILRIFMAYKPLNEKIEIEEQTFTQFNRTGFTVVEWGGTEVQ